MCNLFINIMYVCMYVGSPQAPLTVKTHTTSSSSKEVPSNGHSLSAAPMQYVAKQPSWPLLNDSLCFQVRSSDTRESVKCLYVRHVCMDVCMYVCKY